MEIMDSHIYVSQGMPNAFQRFMAKYLLGINLVSLRVVDKRAQEEPSSYTGLPIYN